MQGDDDATMVAKRPVIQRPGEAQPYLVVLSGSSMGRSYQLTKASYLIGRGSEADIRLEDEGVSRLHAKVVLLPKNIVMVKDLGSTNGTYVNGRQVRAQALEDGARIRIGATACLQFTREDDIEAGLREHLYSKATRDALTKIPNRRVFEEQLMRCTAFAKRHGQALSVLMLDIDHFKQVNDQHGHLVGDDVLRQLAALLVSSVRVEDTLARLGGEEFGMLAPGSDLAQAVLAGERLRRAVAAQPFETRAGSLPVTISVGAAQYDPRVHESPADLLAAADVQLYEAKKAGRNRVAPLAKGG